MRVTFAQSGMPLSMGLFFTLLVIGLNSRVPAAMYKGLLAHGVPAANAAQLSHVPPLGYIFAAFLGLNPLKSLLGPAVLNHLAPGQAAAITGRAFFPHLIGPPFKDALMLILGFAVVMSVIAAIASALRGEKFIHVDEESIAQRAGLHHGHGLRIHHDRDGKAVRDPLDSAAQGSGANGAADEAGAAQSPGELIGSALPGSTAPAARE